MSEIGRVAKQMLDASCCPARPEKVNRSGICAPRTAWAMIRISTLRLAIWSWVMFAAWAIRLAVAGKSFDAKWIVASVELDIFGQKKVAEKWSGCNLPMVGAKFVIRSIIV